MWDLSDPSKGPPLDPTPPGTFPTFGVVFLLLVLPERTGPDSRLPNLIRPPSPGLLFDLGCRPTPSSIPGEILDSLIPSFRPPSYRPRPPTVPSPPKPFRTLHLKGQENGRERIPRPRLNPWTFVGPREVSRLLQDDPSGESRRSTTVDVTRVIEVLVDCLGLLYPSSGNIDYRDGPCFSSSQRTHSN